MAAVSLESQWQPCLFMMLHVPTCIAMCIASADVASVHGPPLSILVDMIRNRAGMFSSLIPWFDFSNLLIINSCLAKLRFTYHVMIFYGNALKINSESLIPDSRISYIDWLVILYLIPHRLAGNSILDSWSHPHDSELWRAPRAALAADISQPS